MCEFNILAMMGEPGHARGDPNLSWESSRWLLIHLPHHSRQFSPGPAPGQLRLFFTYRCSVCREILSILQISATNVLVSAYLHMGSVNAPLCNPSCAPERRSVSSDLLAQGGNLTPPRRPARTGSRMPAVSVR